MRVRRVTRHSARVYLKKAEEFLSVAIRSLDHDEWDAVASNAVQAGISAVDAFTAWTFGERPAGEDHGETIHWLKGKPGKDLNEKIPQLERLLAIKTAVQYGPTLTTESVARQAHLRASRLVEWARGAIREGS